MLKLKNGAQLIRLETNKKTREQFALGYLQGRVTPWATWAVDKDGYTYWGHYFCDGENASLDLAKRVGGDHG